MPGCEAVYIVLDGGFLVVCGAVGVIGFGIAEDFVAHASKKYNRDRLWYIWCDYICAGLSGGVRFSGCFQEDRALSLV